MKNDEVKAEEFTEARDKETGRYVSNEEAEAHPEDVVIEEFIVLREREDVEGKDE